MSKETELYFVVGDTTEKLQRHLREITSCGMMLRLLEGISTPTGRTEAAPAAAADPLDKMILSLCGNKPALQGPPLHEVMEREPSLYRMRVARGKQQLRRIVMGATPEQRLQNIVNNAVEIARTEHKLPQRPMTAQLAKLVAAVTDIQSALPDMIGAQFNLEDAQQLNLQPHAPQLRSTARLQRPATALG